MRSKSWNSWRVASTFPTRANCSSATMAGPPTGPAAFAAGLAPTSSPRPWRLSSCLPRSRKPAAAGQSCCAGSLRSTRCGVPALYRLIEDHFAEFCTVYDERLAHRYGYWRPVIAEGVEKYLACGILEHGFAGVRCGACKHEYLLAFSCKCRYFCPSCHAKRLALWGLWPDAWERLKAYLKRTPSSRGCELWALGWGPGLWALCSQLKDHGSI